MYYLCHSYNKRTSYIHINSLGNYRLSYKHRLLFPSYERAVEVWKECCNQYSVSDLTIKKIKELTMYYIIVLDFPKVSDFPSEVYYLAKRAVSDTHFYSKKYRLLINSESEAKQILENIKLTSTFKYHYIQKL